MELANMIEYNKYLYIAFVLGVLYGAVAWGGGAGPEGARVWPSPEIVVSAVGDIMLGSTYPEEVLPADEERLSRLTVPTVWKGADLVLGNLEGPICASGVTRKCKEGSRNCFAFRMPVTSADELQRSGFHALSISNNHSLYFGRDCLEETVSHLRSRGIQPFGGRLVAEFEVKGKRIAVLGFSYLPSEYAYSILDVEEATRVVGQYKEKYDLVIVSFHGGAEGAQAQRLCDCEETFLGEKRGNVVRFARAVVDAGADLVIGHGPHVLRGLEVYRGKLIAYSLGNFYTYGFFKTSYPNGITAVLRVWLSPQDGSFVKGSIHPLRQSRRGVPDFDKDHTAINILKNLSKTDLGCDLEFDKNLEFFTISCPKR